MTTRLPRNEMMVFSASFVHIVYAKLGQASARDNEVKPSEISLEWIRTSDPVIRSPARYLWTTEVTKVMRLKYWHFKYWSSFTDTVSMKIICLQLRQGNSVARDLPPTGSEANTTIYFLYIFDIDSHCSYIYYCFLFPEFIFSVNVGKSIKCKKNITSPPPQITPTFDMFEIKNQNKGIEDYIGYRFPLSLSTIWRNHLPFNQ